MVITAPTATCQMAASMPASMRTSSAGTPVRNSTTKFDSAAATRHSTIISTE